jgi:hypothetical protein
MVMKKEEIAPGIVLYDNVINDYESIINYIEESVALKIIPWAFAGVKSEATNEIYKKNKTLTISIPYPLKDKEEMASASKIFQFKMREIFFNAFDPIEKDYTEMFGIRVPDHETYAILKYGVGQNFANHIDDHQLFHRRVSTVYYLNEDYLGGEINFPRFNISLKPKANQMIIFPSTYVYNHSVSPITEGTRYSVASWLR